MAIPSNIRSFITKNHRYCKVEWVKIEITDNGYNNVRLENLPTFVLVAIIRLYTQIK